MILAFWSNNNHLSTVQYPPGGTAVYSSSRSFTCDPQTSWPRTPPRLRWRSTRQPRKRTWESPKIRTWVRLSVDLWSRPSDALRQAHAEHVAASTKMHGDQQKACSILCGCLLNAVSCCCCCCCCRRCLFSAAFLWQSLSWKLERVVLLILLRVNNIERGERSSVTDVAAVVAFCRYQYY